MSREIIQNITMERLDGAKVTKSNALINIGQGLDKSLAIIVDMAASQINPTKGVDANRKTYTISVHTYAEKAGIPLPTARRHVVDFKKNPPKAFMKLPETEVDEKGMVFRLVPWMQDFQITKDGLINIKFSDVALQLLCDFNQEYHVNTEILGEDEKLAHTLKLASKSKYTTMSLADCLQFKSRCSMIIYQRLFAAISEQSGYTRFEVKKKIMMREIKEMYDLLDEEGNPIDHEKSLSSNVIKRMVKKGVDEINKLTVLNVEFDKRHNGEIASGRGKEPNELLFRIRYKKTNDELIAEYDEKVNELKESQEFYDATLAANPKRARLMKQGMQEAKDEVNQLKKEFKTRGLKLPEAKVLEAI